MDETVVTVTGVIAGLGNAGAVLRPEDAPGCEGSAGMGKAGVVARPGLLAGIAAGAATGVTKAGVVDRLVESTRVAGGGEADDTPGTRITPLASGSGRSGVGARATGDIMGRIIVTDGSPPAGAALMGDTDCGTGSGLVGVVGVVGGTETVVVVTGKIEGEMVVSNIVLPRSGDGDLRSVACARCGSPPGGLPGTAGPLFWSAPKCASWFL